MLKKAWGDQSHLTGIYAGFAGAAAGILYAYNWWYFLCGRFCNKKISVNEYNNILYREEAKKWETDYDICNPATTPLGKKRFAALKSSKGGPSEGDKTMEQLIK